MSSRKIKLARGVYTTVSKQDYEKVSKFKWYASCSRGITVAARYRMLMHRFIMNAKKNELVDHRDGNTLNNRRRNLRKATHAQNTRNRRKQKSKSRYKGVCWYKDRHKWSAQIRFNRKLKHLGTFTNEIRAAQAYDRAARQLFGVYAAVNFPKKGERGCRH